MVPEWIWIEMVLLKAQAGLFQAITKNERPEFQVAAVEDTVYRLDSKILAVLFSFGTVAFPASSCKTILI